MGFSRILASSVLLSFVAANSAFAQCADCQSGSGDIRVVRVPEGGAPEDLFCASGATDLTINLDAYDWSSSAAWVIHVFDCATSQSTPTQNLGKLTINGDPQDLSSLRVLVAGAAATWTNVSTTVLDTAVVNFSGLEISDPDLLVRTTASVAVSGDITQVATEPAGLHANAFVRVQARGRDGGTERLGGSINGPIIAEGISAFANQNAIGAVIAWNKIGAKIEAKEGNIGLVHVVGNPAGTPAPLGIQGDILAEKGRIGSIFTSAPIDSGTPTLLKIIAGNGITQIRTVDEAGSLVTSSVDVSAEIVAHKAMLDDPANFAYSNINEDGIIRWLEVKGDLHGEIHVANLADGSDSTPTPVGIYVHNVCYAPITVDYYVSNSNIVARTFTAPIYVGRGVQGAIVATGGATPPTTPPAGYLDGHIPTLTIGAMTDAEIPVAAARIPSQFFVIYRDYYTRGRGLLGLFDIRPVNAPPLYGSDWFSGSRVGLGGAMDACIRAEGSIGYLDVASLTHMTQFAAGDFPAEGCEKYSPAIESPVIEHLKIQDLVSGTVWSGSQFADSDPASVYAVIDQIEIGCMRRLGTLRVKDWSTFTVANNMFGDIHVPSVAPSEVLWIGGVMGDDSVSGYDSTTPSGQVCLCTVNSIVSCETCTSESYYTIYSNGGYRNPTFPGHGICSPTGAPDHRGQVWIHDVAGLQGQIIINGENIASTAIPSNLLWTGVVQVGETAPLPPNVVGCPETEIVQTASNEWQAPQYEGLPSELGGGAIGLVPFALHDFACDPVNPQPGNEPIPTLVDVYFNNTGIPYPTTSSDPDLRNSLKLEFYGPLLQPLAAQPLLIEYHPDGGSPRDVTQFFNVTSLGARGLELTRSNDNSDQLYVGLYTARPSALYCGGLNSVVPVADFVYRFRIGADCNFNGVRDARDIQLDPALDVFPVDSEGNPLPNGVIDQCETCSWRPCYDVCCPADYNADGGVDAGDLAPFFNDFEQGLECADVDGSGGVDGGDLGYFFFVFEQGGC